MGLKSGVLSGVLGGLMAEIIIIIVAYGLGLADLFGITEPMEVPLAVNTVGGTLIAAIITGIFFGAVYAKLYPTIPGEALTKGVYYGLLFWIPKDVLPAIFLAAGYGVTYMAIDIIIIGFPTWPACGVVVAALYERIEGTE